MFPKDHPVAACRARIALGTTQPRASSTSLISRSVMVGEPSSRWRRATTANVRRSESEIRMGPGESSISQITHTLERASSIHQRFVQQTECEGSPVGARLGYVVRNEHRDSSPATISIRGAREIGQALCTKDPRMLRRALARSRAKSHLGSTVNAGPYRFTCVIDADDYPERDEVEQ